MLTPSSLTLTMSTFACLKRVSCWRDDVMTSGVESEDFDSSSDEV